MKYTYTRYWGIFTVPGEAPGAEKLVGYGYSGAVMALNDIHKSNIEMVGPLPAGTYVIENVYDDSRRGVPHVFSNRILITKCTGAAAF